MKNKVHCVSLIYYNHVHNLQADYASLIQGGSENSQPLSKNGGTVYILATTFSYSYVKRGTKVYKFTLIKINIEKNCLKIIVLKALGSNQVF